MNLLRRLSRRPPAPTFRIGDKVRFRDRAMAISEIRAREAYLIWYEDGSLRTCGFVPLTSLKIWSE